MAEASAFVRWQERLATPIADFAARLQALTFWWRLAAAVLAGAVSAFAQAPFYVWPLLFVTMPAFVWLLDGTRTARRPWLDASATGWGFGFGYFLVGLHWIAFAFLV